jgi:hypothetical protein
MRLGGKGGREGRSGRGLGRLPRRGRKVVLREMRGRRVPLGESTKREREEERREEKESVRGWEGKLRKKNLIFLPSMTLNLDSSSAGIKV